MNIIKEEKKRYENNIRPFAYGKDRYYDSFGQIEMIESD